MLFLKVSDADPKGRFVVPLPVSLPNDGRVTVVHESDHLSFQTTVTSDRDTIILTNEWNKTLTSSAECLDFGLWMKAKEAE
jgi:hypothetical protein